MKRSALIVVADGSEEMELVITADVLRRAGAEVVIATINEGSLIITASRGVKIIADAYLSTLVSRQFDVILLPGGIDGVHHLRDCEVLRQLIEKHDAEDRLIAAICAAPAIVLKPLDIIRGRAVTCHPGLRQHLEDEQFEESRVVSDGNLITSQGPGTTFEFALTIVEYLFGPDNRLKIEGPLVLP